MLKNDDVIEKIMWPWLLFWCFLKDFTLYHTHAKYHILGFSGSGFMEESPFAFLLGYSILKKPSLVRAKAIVRNNSEKFMFIKIHVLKKTCVTKLFNPIQHGLFRGCSRMGGELFAPSSLKSAAHILKMVKLGTVILYLRKFQKMYKSRDTSLEFCWYQHFFTRNQ